MTEVNYNGKEELLMADYEGISDSNLSSKYANTDFDITDAPSTYITNAQMTYALTCKRLFPAGDTYICNDEGTYKKGHTYTIKVTGETKSWEDVTPTPAIDDAPTATSNNPVKSSGIYTAIQGKQDKLTAGTNITIDANNVISASGGGGGKLYLHTIKFYDHSIIINIYTGSSELFTIGSLTEWMYSNGYVDSRLFPTYNHTNWNYQPNPLMPIVIKGISAQSTSILKYNYEKVAFSLDNNNNIIANTASGSNTLSPIEYDMVTEI